MRSGQFEKWDRRSARSADKRSCPRLHHLGSTTTTGTIPTDKLFTGQQQESGDALGLYNYGARFYSTALGRFLSVDPVVGNAANPQSWNPYSYAGNNPLRFKDPTGKKRSDVVDLEQEEYKAQRDREALQALSMLSESERNSLVDCGALRCALVPPTELGGDYRSVVYDPCHDGSDGCLAHGSVLDQDLQMLSDAIHCWIACDVTGGYSPIAITPLDIALVVAPVLIPAERGSRAITVLGHFGAGESSSYEKFAQKFGANYFYVDEAAWGGMSVAERKAANLRFPDEAVARNDIIVLSSRLLREPSAFADELAHLAGKGYVPDWQAMRMLAGN